MSRIVAVDCETTGLDPATEDVFEVALVEILGDPDLVDLEHVFRIEPRPSVVSAMHPKALEVNRYYERTADPSWAWHDLVKALDAIRDLLDGAHIVGAVPDFDTRHLTSLYRRFFARPPRWHYHLIDVEAMAVGWLHGYSHARGSTVGSADTLPWESDDLSRECGIEPPSEDERHTALGDARWVARWYRALTGGAW